MSLKKKAKAKAPRASPRQARELWLLPLTLALGYQVVQDCSRQGSDPHNSSAGLRCIAATPTDTWGD